MQNTTRGMQNITGWEAHLAPNGGAGLVDALAGFIAWQPPK